MKEKKQASGQRLKQEPKNKKRIIMVSCAIALCLTGGYLGLCAKANTTDTIYPKTSMAGVEIGGLTQKQAEQVLQEQAVKQLEGQSIFFRVTGQEPPFEVRIPASALSIDYVASAELAIQTDKEMFFLKKGSAYLRAALAGRHLTPVYVTTDALDTYLASIDEKILAPVQESHYTVNETTLDVTKGTPGHQVDKEALKTQILALLAKGETIDENVKTVQFTVPLQTGNPQKLDMQKVHDEVFVEAKDACLDEETTKVLDEVKGISFDVPTAQQLFDPLDWGASCQVPLIITEPELSRAELEASLYNDLLGACTTNISGSSNRLANVKLAASLCNEKVLLPGKEFSYNGVVGSRTVKAGFLPAPAYVGGATVNEIGGGVCQVSSTIYLASLRSNLEILERYNHGYVVKYVPDGMDATVYYGQKDFRFKNNTQYPIKIVSTVTGRTLSVSIYGTKTDNLTVEMEGVETGRTSYKTVYKLDSSLPAGTTKVSVTPYSGCSIEVYRCIYENGVQISRTLESKNKYKSRDKVVLVSPADAAKYGLAASTPAPAPTPTPTSATIPAPQAE